MPSSAAARPLLLLLLFFSSFLVLQMPSLLGSRSAHAAVADPTAGRRLLPAHAVPELQPVDQAVMKEKVAAHPLAAAAMERTATRRSGSGWSAFVDAVSKHQVPSGANPDSN